MVVSDIQLISDKEAIPHGYSYIEEHLEPSENTHIHGFVLIHLCTRLVSSPNHHNYTPILYPDPHLMSSLQWWKAAIGPCKARRVPHTTPR